MISVRAMVAEAAADLVRGDLQPADLRALLGRLSGLLATCNTEIRHADAVYAQVLLERLNGEEAANRAKIRAQTSPEYARVREARDTKEACVEMVRALKYQLKSLDEEMRLSR